LGFVKDIDNIFFNKEANEFILIKEWLICKVASSTFIIVANIYLMNDL